MYRWVDATLQALRTHWQAWAWFAGYLALTWVVSWLGRWLTQGLIRRLTARSNTTLDDMLVKAATGPVRLTVFAIGLRLAMLSLRNGIPSFQEGALYGSEFTWVEKVASALVILAVTALVNALMKAAADWYLHELAGKSNATWDKELLPLVKRLLSVVIYFVGFSIIFELFNYPITALLTTAGVASLAIALAAQETLSNMLGGLVILVDRPFRVGDVIELTDGKSGEVVEIGLRSTRIRQFDGNALVVPNKDMANSRVINMALPNQRAAIRQTIGVSYDSDVERAKELLIGVMASHPEVLKDPAPGAWFTAFGPSSLDIFISCWVESYKDRFRIADELNTAILKACRENGIVIPYPQQDVHLYQK